MKLTKYLLQAVLISAFTPMIVGAEPCLDGVCATSYTGPDVPPPAGIEATFPLDAQPRAPKGSLYGSTVKWERNQASAPTYNLQSAGCGLIAAEALLRFFKNDRELNKIMEIQSIASQNGLWTARDGMTNRNAERDLVERLFRDNGVNVQVDLVPHSDFATDTRLIRESLDRGKPVIINTTQHYFFAEGYNDNGYLYVGYTGTIKTGQTEMKLENISGSSGGVINFIIPK